MCLILYLLGNGTHNSLQTIRTRKRLIMVQSCVPAMSLYYCGSMGHAGVMLYNRIDIFGGSMQ